MGVGWLERAESDWSMALIMHFDYRPIDLNRAIDGSKSVMDKRQRDKLGAEFTVG